MIEAEARNAGVQLPREVRDELATALSAEPSLARGELAKLMLYARDSAKLEHEDLTAILSGAAASNVDQLIDFALAGDLAGLEATAVHGLADGGDAAQAASRLAQRIVLMLELREGGGQPAALFRLPYSVRNTVVAQANAWAPDALTRRLPSLLGLLILARRSQSLARGSTFRALCALAFEARRRKTGT